MRPSLAFLPLLALTGPTPGDWSVAAPARTAAPVAMSAGRVEGGRPRGFYFSRSMYSGGGWYPAWTTDYPKADLQLLTVLRRLMPMLDLSSAEHPIRLDDPQLRRYPFVYAVEVGHMDLTEAEVAGLRAYLAAGGFLMVDDFWGTREWEVFQQQIRRVLPGRAIVEIPLSHPIFHTYYDVAKVVQVPNVRNACRGGPTWEQDGYVPAVRGILDDNGRLMVLISWNSDLGDAWEWAEQACYPLEYSTYAFQLTVNTIVYAMSR